MLVSLFRDRFSHGLKSPSIIFCKKVLVDSYRSFVVALRTNRNHPYFFYYYSWIVCICEKYKKNARSSESESTSTLFQTTHEKYFWTKSMNTIMVVWNKVEVDSDSRETRWRINETPSQATCNVFEMIICIWGTFPTCSRHVGIKFSQRVLYWISLNNRTM